MPQERIAWLDHAKGLCIVLVVALYATDLVERTMGASGWLGEVTAFARTFRMPAFFLLSALLLSRAIDRDWRTYLDRKVLHFAYFYVLWLTLLSTYEAPRVAEDRGWSAVGAEYSAAFVSPYSMLWFIYLLPVFFIVTRLLLRTPGPAVWTAAAILQVAAPETGIKVLDKFVAHYVFFYTGYLLAPQVLRLAGAAARYPSSTALAILLWGVANGIALGYDEVPGASLLLGLAGAAAVIAAAVLLSRFRSTVPLRYCGEHSIVIYLAFLVPLEVTRKLLELSGAVQDPGWTAAFAAAGGVLGAFAVYWAVRGNRLGFLFERPALLTLRPARDGSTSVQTGRFAFRQARRSSLRTRRRPARTG